MSVTTMRALITNISVTFGGHLGYAACQWGILVCVAHYVNDTAVGRFALAYAIAAPVFLLANFQLREVFATDAGRRFTFRQYCHLRLLTTVIALLAIAVTTALLLRDSATRVVVVLISLGKAADSIFDIFAGRSQKTERMHPIAVGWLANGLSSLALVWILLTIFGSVEAAAVGTVCGSLIGLGTLLGATRQMPDGPVIGANARPVGSSVALILHALPLGFVSCVTAASASVPRVLLEQHSDLPTLGLFAAVGYFATAASTLAAAVAQSTSARLSRLYCAGNVAGFRRFIDMQCGLAASAAFAGVAIAVIFGEELLRMSYGHSYARGHDIFIWLIAATGLSFFGWFLNSAIVAARRFHHQAVVSLCVCAITFVTGSYLISHYGLVGAAATSVVTATSHVGLSAAVVSDIVRAMERQSIHGARHSTALAHSPTVHADQAGLF